MIARAAVRFRPGQRIVDLGCGPGTDARLLQILGCTVHGVDLSPGMVQVARDRGVDAEVASLDTFAGSFDGALSNFGALNCLPSLRPLGDRLRDALPVGAWLVLIVIGAWCPAEDVALVARGRRPRRGRPVTVEGLPVFMRTLRPAQVVDELGPGFRLARGEALGALMPPPDLGGGLAFAGIDAALGALPILRNLGDHTLIELRRT